MSPAYDTSGELIASREGARDAGYKTSPVERTRYEYRVPGYQTVYGDPDTAWKFAERMKISYIIEVTLYEKRVTR